MDRVEFLEKFYDLVCRSISEEGINPAPWMEYDKEKSPPMTVGVSTDLDYLFKKALKTTSEFFVFGVDRFTKPEQGTVEKDVLSCCFIHNKQREIYTIEYNSFTLDVRPMDFNNKFWIEQFNLELDAYDLRENCEQWKDLAREEMDNFDAFPPGVQQVCASGAFLGQKLREQNRFSDNEIHDICFNHGRKCFGSDPWKAALKVLNEIKKGTVPILSPMEQQIAERMRQ